MLYITSCHWWRDTDRWKRKYSERNPSTRCTTSPTWTGSASNLGFRGVRAAANFLSQGTGRWSSDLRFSWQCYRRLPSRGMWHRAVRWQVPRFLRNVCVLTDCKASLSKEDSLCKWKYGWHACVVPCCGSWVHIFNSSRWRTWSIRVFTAQFSCSCYVSFCSLWTSYSLQHHIPTHSQSAFALKREAVFLIHSEVWVGLYGSLYGFGMGCGNYKSIFIWGSVRRI